MSLTMKKIGAVSMTAAALLVASWGAQATDSSPSAVVHITATVVGKTCTPEWEVGKNVEVNLGKVTDTALVATGDVGATKPFVLALKNCDSGVKKVVVTAMGQADSGDSKAFANTAGTGAATGVAVTLFGGADQKIQLTPNSSSNAEYTVTDGTAEMTFLAKLERSVAADTGTTKGVADGKVESTATLFMSYE